jgi:hypothetical protein
MYTPIRHELRHARRARPGTLVNLCLLSGHSSLCTSVLVAGVYTNYIYNTLADKEGRAPLVTTKGPYA